MNGSDTARNGRLAAEFGLLFVALPVALAVFLPGKPVLPALWLAAFGCGRVLWRDPSFDRGALWRREGFASCGRSLALRFLLSAFVLTAALLLLEPRAFLILARTRPALWAAILVLYPVLSVFPQGIVYRAFLFHRYRGLVPSERARIALSAAAFSFAHVVFLNGWALALSLIGGWFFATTYARTRSVLISNVEHACYGGLLFTIGYGAFFYHGTAHTLTALLPHLLGR